MEISAILTIIIPAVLGAASGCCVALFNNWDKFNHSKTLVKDTHDLVQELDKNLKTQSDNVEKVSRKMTTISSAQRTILQTIILSDCKRIDLAIKSGNTDYKELLKQLIILYREYYLCGFNNQGRLYFDDIITKASKDNNTMVRELMNNYFSEYDPDAPHNTDKE